MKSENKYKFILKISGILLLIVILFLLFSSIVKNIFNKAYLINSPSFSQAVYSGDNKLMYLSLSTDEKYRLFVPLDKISTHFKKAILAQEDKYFYYHFGINPLALIRGFYLTYFYGHKTGGSTISMQIARMRFKIKSRNIVGKIKQILFAVFIEIFYSKDEILEAYLNSIPFAGNIEGIGAASLIYLKKDAKDINLAESSLLAVIPESPKNRNPIKDNDRLYKAAEILVLRMDDNKLSIEEIRKVKLSGFKEDLPKKALHLSNRLLNQNSFTPKIYSTINLNFQTAFENQVTGFTKKNINLGITNASVLLVDCSNMEVKAYVGSADFWNKKIQGQVDGISSRRSPGSVLKPFIYGLGLEKGMIHPGTIMKDIEFSRASYNPENYEKDFVGLISATEALVRSRNLPAVMLLNQITPNYYLDFLRNAGIQKLKNPEFYGLSLALGGVEVCPDEVASLYCSLNNNGELFQIKYEKKDGINFINKIFSKETAFLLKEMLKENDPPINVVNTNAANKIKIPWKTGTSFGFKDAWSSGLIGHYALVVWVGNFNGKENPVFIGRETAGVLFFKLVDTILSLEKIKEDNRTPFGVKKINVCSKSGDLPGKYCDHLKSSWFIPGKSPIKTCQVHRAFNVDPVTGLATCKQSKVQGNKKIFEVWSSDLIEVYQKSGIKLKSPPAYGSECFGYTAGQNPLISSPQENIIYKLESDRLEIPLSAVVDSDVKELTWFIDDKNITTVKTSDKYFWLASSGNYTVRVVDDQGRSNSINIKILGKEIK